MLTGVGDFMSVVQHLFRSIGTVSQHSCKAYNSIHGRANIMAHISQEITLGLISALGQA